MVPRKKSFPQPIRSKIRHFVRRITNFSAIGELFITETLY